jgi:diguanylate cyclase
VGAAARQSLEEGTPASERTEAIQLSAGLIDLAIEMMSQASSMSHDHNARAGEAYRLFAVAQNLSTEKERQRAALLDWKNQLMFDVATGLSADQLPRIGSSDFGLWFRPKGADAFQSTDEARSILNAMNHIDAVALPRLDGETRESRMTFLREIATRRARSVSTWNACSIRTPSWKLAVTH